MFLYTEEDSQSLACWRNATIRQKHGTRDILLYTRLRITTLKQLFHLHIFSCILMPVNPFQVFFNSKLSSHGAFRQDLFCTPCSYLPLSLPLPSPTFLPCSHWYLLSSEYSASPFMSHVFQGVLFPLFPLLRFLQEISLME